MTSSPEQGAAAPGAAAPVRILYCHCSYAKVIDPAVKARVLAGLAASGIGFEAVADLCEMSARKDESLARLAAPGPAKIAACFPRAVKWLFHAAGQPLAADAVEVLNMREQDADAVLEGLLRPGVCPNIALEPAAPGAVAEGAVAEGAVAEGAVEGRA